jgi:hypothetical protein
VKREEEKRYENRKKLEAKAWMGQQNKAQVQETSRIILL